MIIEIKSAAQVFKMALNYKKKIILFFSPIYLIILGLTVFLLFFSTEMELTGNVSEFNGESLIINAVLKNNSNHAIEKIDLAIQTDTETRKVKEIEKLSPNQKQIISFKAKAPKKGELVLTATTKFGSKLSAVISLPAIQNPLRISLTAKENSFKNDIFEVKLEVCNIGSIEINKIELEQLLNPDMIEGKNPNETIELGAGDCYKKSYYYTGKQEGSTKIIFNIKTLSDTKTIEKTMEILQ